jgi:nucleoid DNA-binding protein
VTKRELVIDVAERLGFTQNEVADVVQATLDSIVESLAEGERLEIRNFGVFEVKTRDARMGRNPRTGQEVPILQKRVATFKPGKALKELVQTGNFEAYEEEVGRATAPAEVPRLVPQATTSIADATDGRPSGVL